MAMTVAEGLQQAVELGEIGVQAAAYMDGRLVLDSWTGIADPDTGRAVDGATVFSIFSISRAVTATALHIQADRGLVEYNAPPAQYWPEYAAKARAASSSGMS